MQLGKVTSSILKKAQSIADGVPEMFVRKGPGAGNNFTNEFMATLNAWVTKKYGPSFVEQRLCSGTRHSVDFYVRSEETVIEVELSLANSHSNLERDIFKVLLGIDDGCAVTTLVVLGKEPAERRHAERASQAICKWVKEHHGVEVLIREIGKARPNHALGRSRGRTVSSSSAGVRAAKRGR